MFRIMNLVKLKRRSPRKYAFTMMFRLVLAMLRKLSHYGRAHVRERWWCSWSFKKKKRSLKTNWLWMLFFYPPSLILSSLWPNVSKTALTGWQSLDPPCTWRTMCVCVGWRRRCWQGNRGDETKTEALTFTGASMNQVYSVGQDQPGQVHVLIQQTFHF